jgi:hypothetical protein
VETESKHSVTTPADPIALAKQMGASVGTPSPASNPTDPIALAKQMGASVGTGAAPASQQPQPVPAPSQGLPEQVLDTMGSVGGVTGRVAGILRGGAETLSGTGELLEKIPGASLIPGEERRQKFLKRVADIGAGGETPEEQTGKLMEGFAEYALGNEALKGLSYTEKMQKVLPFLKTLESDPVLAKAIKTGLTTGVEQGTLSGTQTAAKTGDVTSGIASGIIGGGTAGLMEGAASAAPQIIKNIMGGGAAKIAQRATDAAAEAGMTKASQNVVENHINEMNALREAGGQPWWTQQDPAKYTGQVTSFPEAVDQVNGVAQDIYKTLNDESGGRFTILREEQYAAHADLADSDSQENVAKAAKADQAMSRFWDQAEGAADPVDHEVAKRSHYKALKLNEVSKVTENAVSDEGSVNGVQLQQGLNRLRQRWGIGTQGRAVMDDVLGPGVQENLEDIARANLTRAGRDSMKEGVQNVLLRTFAKAAAGETVLHDLFGVPVGMSTLGGTALYLAGKKFLQLMETNPKIGSAMVWAVEHRVPPQTYVPIVSRLVTNIANSGGEDTSQTEPSTVSEPHQQ